jgi:hypothetical protein
VRLRRLVTVVALLLACVTLTPLGTAQAACANRTACENVKPGTSESNWLAGTGDHGLLGYTTAQSVNAGETVQLKVDAPTAYHVDILRLGWYQGNGARLLTSVRGLRTQHQPACSTDPATGLIDCANWLPSVTWHVPARSVSGLYVAHLVRDDNELGQLVPFVVRNDGRHAAIAVQTSDETWQAYNAYGGNSLYQCGVCPPGNPEAYRGAFKVSYNRPYTDADTTDFFTSTEYPMLRWLERSGYDLTYLSGYDVATRPAEVLGHRAFLSVGHDEYWSRTQRENVYGARNAGVSLGFFSGNEVFWKTRWENNGRTLVCYKDTHFNARVDPVEWTGTWRDPRFRPAAEVVPENNLTGQYFLVNSGTTAITVPARYRTEPIWRNTAVASLPDGASLTLGVDTLGYEWDVTADNGFNPPGLTYLSETVDTDAEVFTDFGSTVAAHQTATHHLTEYRAASGALVFGAGTVQWSWGLDGPHADATMQQATRNVLADMGAS